MAHFSGVDAQRVSRQGPIEPEHIAAFMRQCQGEGWIRFAVGDYRILASFNENGDYLHPEVPR